MPLPDLSAPSSDGNSRSPNAWRGAAPTTRPTTPIPGLLEAWTTLRHPSCRVPTELWGLLEALASFGGPHSRGLFPSMATLALKMGCSKRTAQRHLTEAQDAGWVTVTRRSQRTNLVDLHLDRWLAKATDEAANDDGELLDLDITFVDEPVSSEGLDAASACHPIPADCHGEEATVSPELSISTPEGTAEAERESALARAHACEEPWAPPANASSPVSLELPLADVRSAWSDAWQARYGQPYPLPSDGLRLLAELRTQVVAQAFAYRQMLRATVPDAVLPLLVLQAQYLAHVVAAFLREPGKGDFLRSARHPLRCLLADLARLGTPWKAPPTLAPLAATRPPAPVVAASAQAPGFGRAGTAHVLNAHAGYDPSGAVLDRAQLERNRDGARSALAHLDALTRSGRAAARPNFARPTAPQEAKKTGLSPGSTGKIWPRSHGGPGRPGSPGRSRSAARVSAWTSGACWRGCCRARSGSWTRRGTASWRCRPDGWGACGRSCPRRRRARGRR